MAKLEKQTSRPCAADVTRRRGIVVPHEDAKKWFTRIPNEPLEHLARLHLSGNEWQVMLCIIRKTWGFGKEVDEIANSQIVKATGLCKAVVSRALSQLADRHVVARRGKKIGLETDWGTWQITKKLADSLTLPELAEPSTPSLELAEPLTDEKLAILQPELAEPSTKVSSPAVTQKKKETIQKKKRPTARARARRKTFEEYVEEQRPNYLDLNYDLELEKFRLYWSEGGRQLRRPKLAWLNWLQKARQIRSTDGTDRRHSQKARPYSVEELRASITRPFHH
jgi:phage replication O-like protein O